MITVVVTGSEGFIGKNLCQSLQRRADVLLHRFDKNNTREELERWIKRADVIYHLAGVNRPESIEEFHEGNIVLTEMIVDCMRTLRRKPFLVLSSSTQATLANAYGQSKREAEKIVESIARVGGQSAIYRLPNVFGKWSRANYNSVVATFCHNVSRDLPVTVSNPNHEVELIYIDDVIALFLQHLGSEVSRGTQWPRVHPTKRITLQTLLDEIHAIRDIRSTRVLPDLSDRFRRCLMATYLSFQPNTAMVYAPARSIDNRGVLCELLKAEHFGQIFVSRTGCGLSRGNHYHDTKVEKFIVLEGHARIVLRHIMDNAVLRLEVTGEQLAVVDIPPGWTHFIENLGSSDLVVLFWASEIFNPKISDTYPLQVEQ